MTDPAQQMRTIAARLNASITKRETRRDRGVLPLSAPPVVRVAKDRDQLARRLLREDAKAKRGIELDCYFFFQHARMRHVESPTQAGYIYVIGPDRDVDPDSAHQPCKIGFSKRPDKRMMELQSAHYEHLTMTFQSRRLWDVATTEEYLHKHFDRYCIRGEWFRLTPDHRNRIAEICGWEAKLNAILGEFYRVYGNPRAGDNLQRDYPRLMELIKAFKHLERESQAAIHYRINP